MARTFGRKIIGEEQKSQLQAVVFSDNNQSIVALKKSQIDNYDELESYKKLRKKRIKIASIRMLVWLLMLVVMPLLVFFSVVIINPNLGYEFFGYKFFIVASESMKPNINKNDCIIVKKVKTKEDVYIGLDISFIRATDGKVVTHQIIGEVVNDDGEIEYITKGTHNPTADNGTVAFHNIIGVRIRTVSWLGNMVMFFRTPYGIVTLLGLFVVCVVGFYISFNVSNDIRAVGGK